MFLIRYASYFEIDNACIFNNNTTDRYILCIKSVSHQMMILYIGSLVSIVALCFNGNNK